MSSKSVTHCQRNLTIQGTRLEKNWDLDETEKSLVTPTDTVVKVKKTDMVDKKKENKTQCGEGSHHSSYLSKKED